MNKQRLLRVIPIVLVVFIFAILLLSPSPTYGGELPCAEEASESFVIADGESWLTGWTYRNPLSITGSSGAGTNYPIELDVEYGSGSSSGAQVFLESHSQTDFDDVRFTDGDGNTELDYWMQEYTASGDATFWVEVADDLATTQTIYIYYGNDTVSTTSDGETTFLFFDDFENNNFNRWATAEGNWQIDSTIEKYGSYCAFGNADATGRILDWDFNEARTDDFMVHAYLRINDVSGTRYTMHGVESNSNAVYIGDLKDNDFMVYNGAWRYYEANQVSANVWYRVEVGIDFTNTNYVPYWNGVLKAQQSLLDSAAGAVADILVIQSVTSSAVNDDQYIDDFFVRNWQMLEPTANTWGGEEAENVAPVNDQAPFSTNLDDTDNLYARYRIYEFNVSVTDDNGYADIDYVQLLSYDYDDTTVRWGVEFDQDTSEFSEVAGVTVIRLFLGSSSYTESGNNLDIVFKIKIEWAHLDVSDDDLKQIVYDASAASDSDLYDVNYDYETRLDITGFALSDGSGTTDRGSYDSLDTITATGTAIYFGSGSDYVASNETDVWISCADVAGGPWSDLTLTNGAFSMTVDSDDVVGLDTYTVKAVQEGLGSGGADQAHASHTDTYIADRVQFTYGEYVDYITHVYDSDGRINVNIDKIEPRIHMVYDYDDTDVTDGSLSVDDDGYGTWTMAHTGSGIWLASGGVWRVGNVPQKDTTSSATVGSNTHGISAQTNWTNFDITWDRVQVQSYSVSDGRDNINENVNIDVTLFYDYDNTQVTDGTVTINGYSAAHQGAGVWRITRTSASVTSVTYNTVTVSGNAYGITEEDQNGQSDSVIWDRLVFVIVADDDAPLGLVQVTFAVTVTFDYDSTTCSSYDAWVSRGGTNEWTEITSSPFYDTNVKTTSYTYDIYSVVSESVHGITAFTSTSESVTWQNNPLTYGATPTFDNPTDSDNFYARYAWYNVTIYLVDPDGYADITWTKLIFDTDGRAGTTFGVGYSEDTNVFNEQAGTTWVELDTSNSFYVKSGNSLNITFVFKIEWAHSDQTNIDISLWCSDTTAPTAITWYEVDWDIETRVDYSSAPAFSDISGTGNRGDFNTIGGIELDEYLIYYGSGDDYILDSEADVWVSCAAVAGSPWSDLTWSSGYFLIDDIDSDDIVSIQTYTLIVVPEGDGAGGTDLYYTTSVTLTYIADRVKVVSVAYGGDTRVDTSTTINFDWTLIYEYDSSQVTTGTPEINSNALAHQGSGVWRYSYDNAGNVGTHTYNDIDGPSGTHGIEAVNQNGITVTMIWDRIQVQSYSASDTRDSINSNVNIDVHLWYDYDNTNVTDGTVTINGHSASHQGDGVWRITQTSASVTAITYNTVTASGNTHGITVEDQNGQSQQVIWDRVNMTLTTNIGWTVIGYNVTLSGTGIFEYDSTSWSGTITWANRFPSESTANTYNYGNTAITSITDPTYGITAFNVGAQASIIFDDASVTALTYDWFQQDVNTVWLIVISGTWTWAVNGTPLDTGADTICVLQSYMNATGSMAADDWAIVDNTGDIGDLIVGSFGMDAYYANVSINCETTIDGTSYDWQVWNIVYAVDILHSIHIEDSGMNIQDNWITFYFHTNWGNGTFYVWDGDDMVGGSLEGWYQVAKPTSTGLHNFTILVNGTQSAITTDEQTKDFSASDSWEWFNFRFTVNPVTLSITDLLVQQNNDSLILSGWIHTPSLSMTWEAFENGTSVDTGSFSVGASGNYHAIYWEKVSITLLANFTLTITAGASEISVYGYSFVIDGSTYMNTYSSSGFFEGDTINNVYEGDPTDTAFWFTMQTILLVLAIPVIMGIAYFAAMARKGKKKRTSDRVNDKFRTPTFGDNIRR